MLTVTRSDGDSRTAARAKTSEEACAIMEAVEAMFSRSQQKSSTKLAWKLNQPPAPNELQTMEDRMRVLLRELFTLKEEQPHDDRVEEAMWTETGD
ncbi:uncharacterized protein PGRI_050220 [Penicillium griseofulvum]|uniref:Uncharacterized protein n=1 Tax=Penicillium patulum TaxID=5078 RepID=A0A135LB31_PENPA|nr:uncharacterized protein PGRI_050220 [Penicillium griseofulvum]KXG46166.1 hypothetical protein PGRI_050220 [Penicillium griseofulvum]